MFRGYQAINARADDFHQNNTRYDEDENEDDNEVNEDEEKKTLIVLIFLVHDIYF